ncbi:MAG: sigma-70 family RNA polymerase sigma factor [Paenibacillus sp.]|nr:sigma-70 family RNA polymerase sigma factor [Paenibacillus sp.]
MADYNRIFKEFSAGEITSFYDEMFPGMMLYAMHILGDDFSYMAEDCVQDAVLTTYERRAEFPNAGAWRGFLLSCIRNNAIAVLRKSNLQRSYLESKTTEELENDSSHALIAHELHEMLFEAIDSLPEKYREIFDLSFESGLKNAEIASMLGLAEVTVKKRKAKLLSILHDKLGGLLDEKSIAVLLTIHAGAIAG